VARPNWSATTVTAAPRSSCRRAGPLSAGGLGAAGVVLQP